MYEYLNFAFTNPVYQNALITQFRLSIRVHIHKHHYATAIANISCCDCNFECRCRLCFCLCFCLCSAVLQWQRFPPAARHYVAPLVRPPSHVLRSEGEALAVAAHL